MATIYIDKKPYEVKEGENLLKTCLGLGFNLPYFCWHPAMHSVGACRQCAVKLFKDEKDEKGKIVMACMTPVQDGMYVSVDDPEAVRFRKSVIEWLMTNHPHDCPVCDEGGECHLQDMTVMTGHSYRRFRFRKRTHSNQDLGPFVTHEMNRCIACYRCTRFYNDYAGGRDFGVFASHNSVYFGRAESGTLESEFAGNLVEICPTGVFTDKTLARHYTRKWDLRTAPSVCVHCSLGCNTIPGERYGTIRRMRNRYNGSVNGYFLCDRGRYGYDFVNSDRRVREPQVKENRMTGLRSMAKKDAIDHAVALLGSARGLIGIGSPRASLEANYALRALVGEKRFFAGVARREHSLTLRAIELLRKGPARLPTLADIASCDGVLLLGENIPDTAPVMSLNVLQAIRQKPTEAAESFRIPYWDDTAIRTLVGDRKGPLFVATTQPTRLDAVATGVLRGASTNLGRTAYALAHLIDGDAPGVEGLTPAATGFIESAAKALTGVKRPLVISGVSSLDEGLLRASAQVARALCVAGKDACLCFVMAECNSFGLALLTDKSIEDAFEEVGRESAEAAIVVENDLYRRAPSEAVDNFLHGCYTVVAIDHLFSRTLLKSDVVLPAATLFEAEGTLVNNEGRAQRCFQVFPSETGVHASWRWLRDIMVAQGRVEARRWRNTDDLIASMADAVPLLSRVTQAAPSAVFRIAGMRVAREHGRYSGRTAMTAHKSIFEPKPPIDMDSPLSFTMEGFGGVPPSALIPRFWAPGWNSPQALNKFQDEVGGSLHGGDPGLRLVEPAIERDGGYDPKTPAAFSPREGFVLVVPFYHVFGSDELSIFTPGVRERSPDPYIALSPADMHRIGAVEGDVASVLIEGRKYRLTVARNQALPPGLAALGYGIPRSPVVSFPQWAKVEKGLP
jgi:NADH-quinone oxidoreductase subunit G